jgi:hypothetical protein
MKGKCPACELDHTLIDCPMFEAMKFRKKKMLVKSNNLCEHCLIASHSSKKCPDKITQGSIL